MRGHVQLLWGVLQHADKLAALDRREADLKAQLQAVASDAQELKNKDGESMLIQFFLPFPCSCATHSFTELSPHLREAAIFHWHYDLMQLCVKNFLSHEPQFASSGLQSFFLLHLLVAEHLPAEDTVSRHPVVCSAFCHKCVLTCTQLRQFKASASSQPLLSCALGLADTLTLGVCTWGLPLPRWQWP